jgi:hypothetical protein
MFDPRDRQWRTGQARSKRTLAMSRIDATVSNQLRDQSAKLLPLRWPERLKECGLNAF